MDPSANVLETHEGRICAFGFPFVKGQEGGGRKIPPSGSRFSLAIGQRPTQRRDGLVEQLHSLGRAVLAPRALIFLSSRTCILAKGILVSLAT
jgi:hypothetical protein